MEFDASLPIWRFLRDSKMRLEASLRGRLRPLRDYLQSRDTDRDIKKKGGDVLGEFCSSNAVCWLSLRSDRDFIRIVLVLARQRIVKLARSARDRTLKFRVARYAIERTGFPGIRGRIDGEITARNRERILTGLITVNGNGRHRIGNCRQFWQRFCIVFRRLRGGPVLLRNIITMMADYPQTLFEATRNIFA